MTRTKSEVSPNQVIALILRTQKDVNTRDLAEVWNTSRQNVHSIVKRGQENLRKYEIGYKLLKAATSKVLCFLKEGMDLVKAAHVVIRVSDFYRVKIRVNVHGIMSIFANEGVANNTNITKRTLVVVDEMGKVEVLSDEVLDRFLECYREAMKLYLKVAALRRLVN